MAECRAGRNSLREAEPVAAGLRRALAAAAARRRGNRTAVPKLALLPPEGLNVDELNVAGLHRERTAVVAMPEAEQPGPAARPIVRPAPPGPPRPVGLPRVPPVPMPSWRQVRLPASEPARPPVVSVPVVKLARLPVAPVLASRLARLTAAPIPAVQPVRRPALPVLVARPIAPIAQLLSARCIERSVRPAAILLPLARSRPAAAPPRHGRLPCGDRCGPGRPTMAESRIAPHAIARLEKSEE